MYWSAVKVRSQSQLKVKLATIFLPYYYNYTWFDMSYSQSCFFISATPLKPLNRISWNFVSIYEEHNVICTCSTKILIHFFLRVILLLNLEIWQKLYILLNQFCQRNYHETAQQNVMKLCKGHSVYMCIFTGFFPGVMSLLNLEIGQN